MAEVLQDIDLSDPQSFADPEVQEQLDELEDMFDEQYEEAGRDGQHLHRRELQPLIRRR